MVAFYCGHGPYLIRMLPPLGAMTEAEVDQVCGIIEAGTSGCFRKEKGSRQKMKRLLEEARKIIRINSETTNGNEEAGQLLF